MSNNTARLEELAPFVRGEIGVEPSGSSLSDSDDEENVCGWSIRPAESRGTLPREWRLSLNIISLSCRSFLRGEYLWSH